MTNQTIIVHGPQGCGKTTNAGRIAKALGMSRVVDEWAPGDPALPVRGVLALTCETPDAHATRRYRVMSFDDAMAAVRLAKSH